MPTAYEMRAAAWRKMKEGALLPLLAGFALLFLLGSLFDAAVNLFGKWQGWITAVPILDVMDQLGITLEPDQEKALAAVTISQATPAYQAATLVVNALWEGVLAFGGSVIAIAAMRGGATAFQAGWRSTCSRTIRTGRRDRRSPSQNASCTATGGGCSALTSLSWAGSCS